MKSLADIIAYNTAHADEALKFGQTQLVASQAHEPRRPGAERRLRHRARHRPHQRAQRDQHRAHDQHARRDHDAERHPDRPRRPRRVPADRRPRRLRRQRPPAGRHRLQRHGLQRGEAARVRLRLRAGDQAAPHAERDQPGDLALLRRRAALLPARQGARHRRPARLLARDGDGAGAAGQADRGDAERGHADEGLHAADRRHEHRGPVDQRGPRDQPEGAGGGGQGRRRARRRHRPRPAARHPRAGQGQPRRRRHADHGGQRRARALDPGPRTRPWWRSCARRARSCSASST